MHVADPVTRGMDCSLLSVSIHQRPPSSDLALNSRRAFLGVERMLFSLETHSHQTEILWGLKKLTNPLSSQGCE